MFDLFIAKLLKKMNIKLIKYSNFLQIFDSHKKLNKIIDLLRKSLLQVYPVYECSN